MKKFTPLKQDIRPLLLSIMLCIFVLSGCDNKKPVLIGFVAGTTGRVADLGISGRDSVQLLVEQCNKQGGIGGRPVRLIIKDDKQDPDEARKATQDLIDQGVAAIVGPMTSDMGMAVTPLLNDARVLAVSPTVTTQHLSGKDDYFFRVSSTTQEYASRSAQYQLKFARSRRLVAVYDKGNSSFCKNWLENFEAPFVAGGGEILAKIPFERKENRSFAEIVQMVLSSEPDGVLIVANSMDSAMLCQQIRKIDPAIYITLADWGATERLLELGGNAVEGVTVVQTFDRDSTNPDYQEFRKTYSKRYRQEPGFPGVYTYDAAQVVLTALKTQKKGQHIKDTILAIREFEGLQGRFSFDDYGDVRRSNASISIVRNRKFVVVD